MNKGHYIKLMIVLIAVLATDYAFSQRKHGKHIIAYTEKRNGYNYIPHSAMADSVTMVVAHRLRDIKNNFPSPFHFWWNSSCNDGYYNLTITPSQIYFHSSHDNPNPDYLFWVMDINSKQYAAIATRLKTECPKEFSNNDKVNPFSFHDDMFEDSFEIPDEWTDSVIAVHDVFCENQIEQQLNRYFLLLNSFIGKNSLELQFPSLNQRKKIKPKLFGTDIEEMMLSEPVQFTPPVIQNDN